MKRKIGKFERMAFKPTAKERFDFNIVTTIALVIFGLWIIFGSDKLFSFKNGVVLVVLVLFVGYDIHYVRRKKHKK